MLKDHLRFAKHTARQVADNAIRRLAVRAVMPQLLRFESQKNQSSGEMGTARLPRVLIARYKSHGSDGTLGDSIEAFFVDNTLVASGLASIETFFWDVECPGFPRGDWAFLRKCQDFKPDFVVFSSYEPGYPRHISIETVRYVRSVWNIPVVAFWWDCCWEGFWQSLVPIMPYVDLHVALDDPSMTFLRGHESGCDASRFMPLWTAVDPALHVNPGRTRDIDVSFLGQVTGQRAPRLPYIVHLMEKNIPIYCSMTTRAQQPPHDKYVEILQRSRIGLNFSHGVSWHCLKARVFEIMACGALLMESTNPQTSLYFQPDRDYVEFVSPEDLATKVRYYLGHEDERSAIAERGETRTREYFNHVAFWSAVMDRLRSVTRTPW